VRHTLVVVALFVVSCAAAVSPAFAGVPPLSAAWQMGEEGTIRSIAWAENWTAAAPVEPPVAVTFALEGLTGADSAAALGEPQAAGRKRQKPFEYSAAYKVRNTIHKTASYLTLPLFIAEYALGAYMYAYPDKITTGLQSAHRTVGISLGALFTVNTVTGVWNLIEARKDPNKKTKRTIHGIAMLVADAGFAVAGLMRPKYPIDNVQTYYNQRQTHRAIAVTSMVIAGVSYLMMLFGSH